MKSTVSRFKNIVENTNNINACMKALNLDMSSTFLCFLKILEDAILNYHDYEDYAYLVKIANYLDRVYNKLTIKSKEEYRPVILKLRKVYKRQMQALIKNDRRYFEKVYVELGIILTNKKEEKDNDFSNIDTYEILHEIIFKFKNLEYLDDFVSRDAKVLNSTKNNISIFVEVIDEYINQIRNNNQAEIDFYERVINKFLLEETFDLTDQMKDNIIKTLQTFIEKNKNLSLNRLKEVKEIIEAIYKRKNLYEIFNINKNNLELTDSEYNRIEIDFNTKRKVMNDYIITIDDDSSIVLDDALSSVEKLPNGNLLLKVHIADPLATFSYRSRIMKDAKNKTSTIYLKDENIPMMPYILSADKLSLNEGEYRYAKTFCFEFDKYGSIVNYYFLNTIIKVSKRMSYDSLNEIYQCGGTTSQEELMIKYYDLIIFSLKKIFKNAHLYESMKKENIIGNSQKIGSFSENLVSYSMMLTGYMTAKYFHDHNLPYAYRCHNFDKDWQKFLSEYINNYDTTVNKKMLREILGTFPSSYYARLNQGHMGLGLDYYSHITSPLRRFCDILNMYALNTCYFNTPNDKDIYSLEQEIDKTCSYINMQNNTIDEYLSRKVKCKD